MQYHWNIIRYRDKRLSCLYTFFFFYKKEKSIRFTIVARSMIKKRKRYFSSMITNDISDSSDSFFWKFLTLFFFFSMKEKDHPIFHPRRRWLTNFLFTSYPRFVSIFARTKKENEEINKILNGSTFVRTFHKKGGKRGGKGVVEGTVKGGESTTQKMGATGGGWASRYAKGWRVGDSRGCTENVDPSSPNPPPSLPGWVTFHCTPAAPPTFTSTLDPFWFSPSPFETNPRIIHSIIYRPSGGCEREIRFDARRKRIFAEQRRLVFAKEWKKRATRD